VEILFVGGHQFAVTQARESDVPALVELLADDVLGKDREFSELDPYLAHRFYGKLGYTASHEGFKRSLWTGARPARRVDALSKVVVVRRVRCWIEGRSAYAESVQ
jgi:hypothetical protein